MSSYSSGQRVRATKDIHRSSGSAYSGDRGRVIKTTGDGAVIEWDNGARTEVVKDSELERD